jgi:hypothetical protein
MKTQRVIWTWREPGLNSKLLNKSRRSSARPFSPLTSPPGRIDAYPRQSTDNTEPDLGAAQASSLIHEVRNTMTALLLTLENLTNPKNQESRLQETIEILKELSNRLNCAIEKFGALFSGSSTVEFEN